MSIVIAFATGFIFSLLVIFAALVVLFFVSRKPADE